MIIYLCTKFQSNTPNLSKDIARKPFFKVEKFSKLKRAITPKIIGGFYPKSNDLHFMIIYLCIKFQSNTPILSNDIARKPEVLRTGRTDVRTDSGDTICNPAPPPHPPPPPPPIWKWRGHKKIFRDIRKLSPFAYWFNLIFHFLNSFWSVYISML